MKKILCSTGALIGMPNNRDFSLIKKCVPNINSDGFEFMMYSTWYDKVPNLLKELKKCETEFPAPHCEKHIGEDLGKNADGNFYTAKEKFKVNCKIANEIGAKRMVMHLWDGIYSDTTIENNIKGYGELIKIAEENEIDLYIENVVCNHHDPLSNWKRLLNEYPDAKLIFDTKMAAFHNQMEDIYENQNKKLWENNIKHLHINDYNGGYMEWSKLKTLPVGEGIVNFNKFFDFINNIGYKGDYTIESTAFQKDGSIDFDMLNRNISKVRSYIKNKKDI